MPVSEAETLGASMNPSRTRVDTWVRLRRSSEKLNTQNKRGADTNSS